MTLLQFHTVGYHQTQVKQNNRGAFKDGAFKEDVFKEGAFKEGAFKEGVFKEMHIICNNVVIV